MPTSAGVMFAMFIVYFRVLHLQIDSKTEADGNVMNFWFQSIGQIETLT